MKKLLSMTLALAMVLTLLAGCGGGGNNQSGGQNNNQNNHANCSPEVGAFRENRSIRLSAAPYNSCHPATFFRSASDVTIQVAALASGYEETYPGMWQEVCDAFTAQTGIKVDLIVDKSGQIVELRVLLVGLVVGLKHGRVVEEAAGAVEHGGQIGCAALVAVMRRRRKQSVRRSEQQPEQSVPAGKQQYPR